MRTQRPALAALVSVLVLLCVVFVLSPRGDRDRHAGLSGHVGQGDFDDRGQPALDPNKPLRSPSGEEMFPGQVDEDGYTLPLDVRRPRTGELGSPQSRGQIEALRAAPRGTGFTEFNLGPDDGHTQNETSIDADGDHLVAGWNSYTDDGLFMGVSWSSNGGQSWNGGFLGGGHDLHSDPAVRAGGNGNWYYAYLASPGSGGNDIDIYVQRSTDHGQTWATPVAATNNTGFDDKPYIDADGDEVLVGFADFRFSPAKVSATRSTDGGATFGNDIVLADNSVGGNGACPVIAPDGTYHMFWRDSFQDSLWIATSTDQGASWSEDRGIVAMNPLATPQPGGFRMVNLPSADADPVTGDLVVVWNDERFGNPDILCIRSSDGGQTWSEPVRVNDDPGTAAQFFPWIDFDPNGVAHVVWYDRREDGFGIDVYLSRSQDGGATWEANTRVTAESFQPILPWDTTVDFIGDYNGIAATAERIYPFYQDSREGNQDVWVALVPNSTTSVPSTSEPNFLSWLPVTPNPFRSDVRLALTADPTSDGSALSSETSIEIVDASGRQVRRLNLGWSGDAWEGTWDGKDRDGHDLPGGVYFARRAGTDGAAARIVKLD